MLVTIVHTPGCHLCEDAEAALAQFAEEHPLRIERVGAATPEGQRLIAAHRPGIFPLVLVGGEFFSAGRLPRGKLHRALARRAVEPR